MTYLAWFAAWAEALSLADLHRLPWAVVDLGGAYCPVSLRTAIANGMKPLSVTRDPRSVFVDPRNEFVHQAKRLARAEPPIPPKRRET
jgi:hypothetical protein